MECEMKFCGSLESNVCHPTFSLHLMHLLWLWTRHFFFNGKILKFFFCFFFSVFSIDTFSHILMDSLITN